MKPDKEELIGKLTAMNDSLNDQLVDLNQLLKKLETELYRLNLEAKWINNNESSQEEKL